MNRKKMNCEIIREPSSIKPLNIDQSFPVEPIMYLELFENKEKIKETLKNKEYVAPKHRVAEGRKSPSPSPSREPEPEPEPEDEPEPEPEDDHEDYDPDDDYEHKHDDIVSIKDNSEDDLDELEERLKQLLEEENNEEDHALPVNRSPKRSPVLDKYKQPRSKDGRSIQHKGNAPTLSEIQKQGGYVPKKELINIARLTDEESDEIKRELLFKFEILQKSYPTETIEEFSIHSDYDHMKRSYDSTVRKLSLHSSVDSYKQWLMTGFGLCESLLGRFGFDMKGFAQEQAVNMHKYDKLLVELGEKSYIPNGKSKWSVESRLFMAIAFQAGMFILTKSLMKSKTGANISDFMSGMNKVGGDKNKKENKKEKKKKRMNGPDWYKVSS